MKIKGTVTSQGKSKFSFYVMLDSKDGYYFNTKFEPKSGVGDVVGIEYDSKGEKRGNVKRIEILEDNGGPKGVPKEEEWSGGGKSGGGKGGPKVQDSIVFQSSRKDALVLVGVLLGEAAFAVKGKTDEKRVQIEGLLDEITSRFFNDATDPRKSAVLTDNAEVDEDAGGGDAPKDEWDDGEKSEWD